MKKIKVVGVEFKPHSQKYYFDYNNLNLKKNLTVIVETERGLQFGRVVTDVVEFDKDAYVDEFKKVIRISSKKDYIQHLNNIKDAEKAKKKCEELIKSNELDMKLISVDYNFERTQLFFSFIANGRVDFRNLAKQLAAIYKVRIELRQIGPRDKAKEVGGLGPCGRPLCCSKYLYTFNNITINMAKKQNLALNPSKINGECDRLMCCLSYENDTYQELSRKLPKVGNNIEKDGIKGKVLSVNTLKESCKVETEDGKIMEIEFKDGSN